MTSCRRLTLPLLLLLLLTSTRLFAQDTYVHIRWVHLIPDGPAMNFHLNSSSSAPLRAPVSFRGASDPVIMADLGTAGIYFTDASSGAELHSANVPLANNTRQNIVLIGQMGSIQTRILSLTIPPPTESPEADFRFMNASPDGGPIDLTITEFDGSIQTVDNLAFGLTTPFLSLSVGMTRLEVFEAGTPNRLLNVQGLVRAGYFYSGFVAGMANDLDFRVLIESDQRAQNPMVRWVVPPPPNDAELRLVNLTVPDQSIDIYMDGVRKIFEVPYRTTSAISGIPSGAHSFAFVRSGETFEQAFHTESLTVATNTSVSAVVMGATDQPVAVRMLVRSMEETVPAGQSKARIMVANDLPPNLDVILRDSTGAQLIVTNPETAVASNFMTLAAGPVILEFAQPGQPAQVRYLGTLPSASIATIFISSDTVDGLSVNMLVETDPAVRRPMVEFTEAGAGAFRFVHASAPMPSVDMIEPAAQTLSFGSAGEGLIPLFEGLLPVVVRPTGTSLPLIDANVRIGSDSLTTAFLVGAVGTTELVQLFTGSEDLSPDSGSANVRIFIAAPIPQSIDVEIIFSTGAKRRFDDLEFKEATAYIRVPVGAITVVGYPRGGTTPLVRLSGAVEDEQILTLIVAGVTVGGEPIVAVLDDGIKDAQIPMPLLAPASTVPGESARITTLGIAPNPARDVAMIEYAPSVAGIARVVVYDVTGRRRAVAETTGDAVSTRRASIPVGTLESGVYSVVVIENDGSNGAAGMLQVVR